jgi:epsilon-lactone hydrolase
MAGIQASLFALVLRVVYKSGWYSAWTGEFTPRDRGGDIEAAADRAYRGFEVTPVDAGGTPSAWIEPSAPTVTPTSILYLHGGGYTGGALDHYLDMLGRLAREYGLRTLYADYRLAPKHVFPAAVDDALAAYRWLLVSGVSPARLIVAGDSAGGGLALATLLAARQASLPLPAAAVLLSPWTDLEGTGESLTTRARSDPMLNAPKERPSGRVYLGGADPCDPLASPLYGDLHGLPPLLIHVGTAEILFDDSRRLADRATAAGVEVNLIEWPGLFHVFPIFTSLLPEARVAVDQMAGFILKHTH